MNAGKFNYGFGGAHRPQEIGKDCICGSCPSCRREMRETDRYMKPLDPHKDSRLKGFSDIPASEEMSHKPPPLPKAVKAQQTRQQLRNERRKGRELVDGRLIHPKAGHGKVSGYIEWSCRCVPCTEAMAVMRAGRQVPRS